MNSVEWDDYLKIWYGSLEDVEKLLQTENPNNIERRLQGEMIARKVFHSLIRSFQFDKVKLFINAPNGGVDINLRNEDGRTPLIMLASSGLYEPFETYIIKKKIKESRRNVRDMVELLISHGADPTLTDNQGNTCLHYCAQNRDFYYFQIFELFGCNRLQPNNEGLIPGNNYPRSLFITNTFTDDTTRESINSIRSLQSWSLDTIKVRKIDVSSLPQHFRTRISIQV